MIIGITGKSGVGKSTYARKIAEETNGWIIEVDKVAHEVMELPSNKSMLKTVFGNAIIKDDVIDRKFLGDLIFSNRHLYKEVSDAIWEDMKHRIDDILGQHKTIIIDWILLPHTHYWKLCDKKILITANEGQRKSMVLQRDKISNEYLEKRDSASIDYDEFTFDEIIENNYMNY